MSGAAGDFDSVTAADPRSAPQQLADIAERRWDLHGVIAANPQAYPELRAWMAQVNPVMAQLSHESSPEAPPPYSAQAPYAALSPYATQPYTAQPPYSAAASVGAPIRPPRRGIKYWIGGCGCLAVVTVVALLAVVGGIGAATSSSDRTTPTTPIPHDQGVAQDQKVAAYMATFETERAKYHELLAELDGNPVAPLVTQQDFMDRVEREAAVENISEITARSVAERAREFRQELEDAVTAAESRRGNSSGTLTEKLVDQAGNGFIDIRWDAATECDDEEPGSTAACVVRGKPLLIHMQAESEATSDWERKMVVAHELAHIFQHADARRFEDGKGDADRMIEKGLFQGSEEKMADCYALTYYDEHTLSQANVTLGYGYVCNASERQAIREWAASINAPMPG
ncbi:hypothetical protein FM104_01720 [Microbacterium esteraromaticum]|uniref:Leucine rich repeat variant domain-containing protein n=1 Tax=Microbacterium esteraromaticum TaxID=57043 RepID=A0A1R4IEJ0_9MICO|nr:hypothetical protein [Microbacterium esteraromaticum]SJN18260.1 hypothetical protein FM104_01720 [Microbacterium esteraromaticum]